MQGTSRLVYERTENESAKTFYVFNHKTVTFPGTKLVSNSELVYNLKSEKLSWQKPGGSLSQRAIFINGFIY